MASPSCAGGGKPSFFFAPLPISFAYSSAAAASAAALGVELLTVHAVGGEAMLRAAVDGAREGGASTGILAVTVLTSFDDAAYAAATPHDAIARLQRQIDAGEVTLTFDNGPVPGVTEQVLETLAQEFLGVLHPAVVRERGDLLKDVVEQELRPQVADLRVELLRAILLQRMDRLVGFLGGEFDGHGISEGGTRRHGEHLRASKSKITDTGRTGDGPPRGASRTPTRSPVSERRCRFDSQRSTQR